MYVLRVLFLYVYIFFPLFRCLVTSGDEQRRRLPEQVGLQPPGQREGFESGSGGATVTGQGATVATPSAAPGCARGPRGT